jgi:hypothetical protein
MTYSLIGDLPSHLYCKVDSLYTHKESQGFLPCVWFGLVSYPGRMWGCNLLLESGAIYRNVPPHAIYFGDDPEPPEWTPYASQTWDCYGTDFTTLEYKFLKGLDCLALTSQNYYEGSYLFTAAPIGDAYSAAPEQAKEFSFIQLFNGRLTIQPTDRVVFRERSFTQSELAFPKGLKRQTEIWSVE